MQGSAQRFLIVVAACTLAWLTSVASIANAQPTAATTAAAPSESRTVPVTAAKPNWPYTAHRNAFRFYSTVPIDHLQPQIDRLISLPEEIQTKLGMAFATTPFHATPIHVIVLADQQEFESYVQRHYPGLKSSRAMFIRDRGPGVVLTWWHPQWLMDSRHEVTHAFLHSRNIAIPLWLDEGLAEYFEHNGLGSDHPVHAGPIRAQLRFGQIADLEEQEKWSTHAQLTAEQYRDAWGTVAFLMHHSDASKDEFLAYLEDLFSDRATGLLSYRMRRAVPRWREAYIKHYQIASKTPLETATATTQEKQPATKPTSLR